MMPKFGLILALLLAKTLAQEDLEPIFSAVGETLELGLCYGVDYMAVYKVHDGEKQLLWNSSSSVPPPDAYKNRLIAYNNGLSELLGVQITDLKQSDSGVYLRECWNKGKISNQHANYLYMCDENVLAQELSLQNGSAVLGCDVSYSDQGSTNIKWFTEVSHKISLLLDTEKSLDLLHQELNNVLQVQDKGFSLYISEAGLEHSKNFFCLVMKKGRCKRFKPIYLPESNKSEMHPVFYAVGEKTTLSCMPEHVNQQQHYWKTPFGEVNATMPHNQMFISNSEGTKDHLLVIPSITFNHSGEYSCWSNSVVVEYYITVCAELVSNNVQVYNGGKVTLACTLTQDESVNILWYRQRDYVEAQLIYDSEDPSIDVPTDMIGRTNIIELNASLVITELDEKDSGTYWCVVLLDSVEQDINDYLEDGDEEDNNIFDESGWLDEDENTETCTVKGVTRLKIQPKNLGRGFAVESSPNLETDSESSPALYAIIGGMLGIVILGLITVVAVVKVRAKRRALDATRAEPRAQQKDAAVSTPLMSL